MVSSLSTYKKKRDFSKTSEPAPGKISKKQGYSFCVQKHDATRLHYDFRLELDGVLKSWAVTKGPSLNPADRRLAVRTEDHPLNYGSFEGTIPESEYGGGTVMLWDEGTWEPVTEPHKGLKEGHIKFELHGKRMKGRWALVLMKHNRSANDKHENWLLIKDDDEEADRGPKADKFLEKNATSVSTKHKMEQIAKSQDNVWGHKKPASKKPAAKKGKEKPVKKPQTKSRGESAALKNCRLNSQECSWRHW